LRGSPAASRDGTSAGSTNGIYNLVDIHIEVDDAVDRTEDVWDRSLLNHVYGTLW
jgi:hypothetical protein